MIDTYVKSQDLSTLDEFCSSFPNVIGPVQGCAAQEVEGAIVPAKGDPAFYYACVRSLVSFSLPPTILPCDEAEGVDVVGVWA